MHVQMNTAKLSCVCLSCVLVYVSAKHKGSLYCKLLFQLAYGLF